jgi:hypothetical protein
MPSGTEAAWNTLPSHTSPFEDLPRALAVLQPTLGASAARTVQMAVYVDRVLIQAMPEGSRDHLVEHSVVDGHVQTRERIPLTVESDRETAHSGLFSLDEVDPTKLAGLIEDTRKRLAYQDGRITHVLLRRSLPFRQGVHWRIYMASTRQSGSVEFDLKGDVAKEYKDLTLQSATPQP